MKGGAEPPFMFDHPAAAALSAEPKAGGSAAQPPGGALYLPVFDRAVGDPAACNGMVTEKRQTGNKRRKLFGLWLKFYKSEKNLDVFHKKFHKMCRKRKRFGNPVAIMGKC